MALLCRGLAAAPLIRIWSLKKCIQAVVMGNISASRPFTCRNPPSLILLLRAAATCCSQTGQKPTACEKPTPGYQAPPISTTNKICHHMGKVRFQPKNTWLMLHKLESTAEAVGRYLEAPTVLLSPFLKVTCLIHTIKVILYLMLNFACNKDFEIPRTEDLNLNFKNIVLMLNSKCTPAALLT